MPRVRYPVSWTTPLRSPTVLVRPVKSRAHERQKRRKTHFLTTDSLGARAAEKPTYCHDLHATALHPLRIHHEQIALYHNGIIRRITDVHGCVLHPILAQTPTVPR